MSRLSSTIGRLVSGSTAVPDFRGRTWRDTNLLAVRHRLVRRVELLAPRRFGDELAGWLVEDQDPRPGRRVPIDSVVTLRLTPAAGPAAPLQTSEAFSASGVAAAQD